MELLFPGSSRVERRFATEIHEIDAAETAVINGITVTAYLVEHACGAPPFALRFVCDGKVLAYRGTPNGRRTCWQSGAVRIC